VLFLLVPALVGVALTAAAPTPLPAIAGMLTGLAAMQSPKVAQQWERGVGLRLGRFHAMQGPGLFFVMPFVDRVS
jgi:regulator of protease activity HflC (stomatin/prohibitin superfamily)